MVIPRIFEYIGKINQETMDYILKDVPEVSMERLRMFEGFSIDNNLGFGVMEKKNNGGFVRVFKWRVYVKRQLIIFLNKFYVKTSRNGTTV